MSMDREVTGVLVMPFTRHVSCNDPEAAMAEGARRFGLDLGMALDPGEVIDLRQRPSGGGREWDCPHCGYRNYSGDALTQVCNGCERDVDVEHEEPAQTTGEFLAEVAEKLRSLAPAVSGMDGGHSDRLFELARAFGWTDPEQHRGMFTVARMSKIPPFAPEAAR